MPKSSPNVFTLCGFTAANEGEGFREIRKHSLDMNYRGL
ncbi:hypothetical protein ACLBQW_13600, partial [Klebsiella pneumoniae]